MNDAPQSKSRPSTGKPLTTAPVAPRPWIACLTCHHRAYLVEGWRPQKGYNPNMRMFSCQDDHDSYKVFTQKQLDMLASTPIQ